MRRLQPEARARHPGRPDQTRRWLLCTHCAKELDSLRNILPHGSEFEAYFKICGESVELAALGC